MNIRFTKSVWYIEFSCVMLFIPTLLAQITHLYTYSFLYSLNATYKGNTIGLFLPIYDFINFVFQFNYIISIYFLQCFYNYLLSIFLILLAILIYLIFHNIYLLTVIFFYLLFALTLYCFQTSQKFEYLFVNVFFFLNFFVTVNIHILYILYHQFLFSYALHQLFFVILHQYILVHLHLIQ